MEYNREQNKTGDKIETANTYNMYLYMCMRMSAKMKAATEE